MSERLAQALLTIFFSLAPATLPAWRDFPRFRPATVLFVGEPTPALIPRTEPLASIPPP